MTSKIPLEFFYLFFSFFILLLTVLFVPKDKFAPLFWVSLLWGFFISIASESFFVQILKLFHYNGAYPFTFWGSPIWLNVAWIGAMMLYLRFLPTREIWYVFPVYILIFSFSSSINDVIFHQIGMLIYTGWNPFYRFIFGIISFYCAAKHQQFLEKVPIKNNSFKIR